LKQRTKLINQHRGCHKRGANNPAFAVPQVGGNQHPASFAVPQVGGNQHPGSFAVPQVGGNQHPASFAAPQVGGNQQHPASFAVPQVSVPICSGTEIIVIICGPDLSILASIYGPSEYLLVII